MAYTVTASILGSLLTAQVNPGQLFGTKSVGNPSSLPPFTTLQYASGTGAGKVNLMCLASGTLTASTVSLDLTAIADPYGTSKNFARGKILLILNYATTDGYNLLVDGTATNAWVAMFNAITTAKLVVPPGYTDATNLSTTYPGGLCLWGGNTTSLAVSGTSKILKLDSGANTIPYAVCLVGCDA